MKRVLVAVLVAASLLSTQALAARSQAEPCRFVLGFADLRDKVGGTKVGACLEDERFNAENGNAEQRTAGGLLVWRKADNFTAFTDGSMSWVAGPNGVQTRPNSERFAWENDPQRPSTAPAAAPARAASAAPAASPASGATASVAPAAAASPGATPAPASSPSAFGAASTPAPSGAGGARNPNAGVAPVNATTCPADQPIKGDQGGSGAGEWIYYRPISNGYRAIGPERCFGTTAEAEAAGYRAPTN